MQAHCSNQTFAVLSPATAEGDHKVGHLLYQAGIVAAVLVFLLSFWAC